MAHYKTTTEEKVTLHFNVIIEKQKDEYVAHCLQLDIVSAAATEDEAISDMNDLIVAQLRFALKHNNLENIFKPAPPEVWQKFLNLDSKRIPCNSILKSTGSINYESMYCYA